MLGDGVRDETASFRECVLLRCQCFRSRECLIAAWSLDGLRCLRVFVDGLGRAERNGILCAVSDIDLLARELANVLDDREEKRSHRFEMLLGARGGFGGARPIDVAGVFRERFAHVVHRGERLCQQRACEFEALTFLLELFGARSRRAAVSYSVRVCARLCFKSADSVFEFGFQTISALEVLALQRAKCICGLGSREKCGPRDALFVGYANDLVVGVWIGNDDNSPLDGISGGGLPAQIWKDFMRQAGGAAAPQANPTQRADPGGPVEPQDVPGLDDIPMEDGSRLRFEDGEMIYSTDVEGVDLDLLMGQDGVRVDSQRFEEVRRRAEEATRERIEREEERMRERYEIERQRLEEQGR